ncbi:30S ribosomal protein S4 [Candidatus Woesearchaeota archaeon]|nr:30S ribosomal protein S4 [Candidatus Woesearchaeota archaeon]
MGAPKHLRRKYSTPSHPWQKERIEKEKELLKEYGLKNKKEIWRMDSILRRFKQQAKSLIARTDAQSKKEEKQLIIKLTKLNLVTESAKMDDILGLDIKDIMGRRLQTQVFSKGMARSTKQARQFIVHGHVMVGDKKVTVPSYLVKQDEEGVIKFDDKSVLISPEHPERVPIIKKEKPEEKKGAQRRERPYDKKRAEDRKEKKKPVKDKKQ